MTVSAFEGFDRLGYETCVAVDRLRGWCRNGGTRYAPGHCFRSYLRTICGQSK